MLEGCGRGVVEEAAGIIDDTSWYLVYKVFLLSVVGLFIGNLRHNEKWTFLDFLWKGRGGEVGERVVSIELYMGSSFHRFWYLCPTALLILPKLFAPSLISLQHNKTLSQNQYSTSSPMEDKALMRVLLGSYMH